LIAACKGEPTQPVNMISVVVETATPTVEVNAAGGAYAINDDGTIVGFSTTALYRAGTVRAIQWSAAGVKTEVAGCSGVCYAAENAINRTGQVVGSQTDRVFRWTPATAVNNGGQIVGYGQ
jgi:probable HAF family extracellular repeat protein